MPSFSLASAIKIGGAILIALAALAIWMGIQKIEAQGAKIATLERDLAAAEEARERDNDATAVLVQGLYDAAGARAIDEEILNEALDPCNPEPLSPGLSALLDGLRGEAGIDAPAPASCPAAGRGAGDRPSE